MSAGSFTFDNLEITSGYTFNKMDPCTYSIYDGRIIVIVGGRRGSSSSYTPAMLILEYDLDEVMNGSSGDTYYPINYSFSVINEYDKIGTSYARISTSNFYINDDFMLIPIGINWFDDQWRTTDAIVKYNLSDKSISDVEIPNFINSGSPYAPSYSDKKVGFIEYFRGYYLILSWTNGYRSLGTAFNGRLYMSLDSLSWEVNDSYLDVPNSGSFNVPLGSLGTISSTDIIGGSLVVAISSDTNYSNMVSIFADPLIPSSMNFIRVGIGYSADNHLILGIKDCPDRFLLVDYYQDAKLVRYGSSSEYPLPEVKTLIFRDKEGYEYSSIGTMTSARYINDHYYVTTESSLFVSDSIINSDFIHLFQRGGSKLYGIDSILK